MINPDDIPDPAHSQDDVEIPDAFTPEEKRRIAAERQALNLPPWAFTPSEVQEDECPYHEASIRALWAEAQALWRQMQAERQRRLRPRALGDAEIAHLLWGSCGRPRGCALCAVRKGRLLLDYELAETTWMAYRDFLLANHWHEPFPPFAVELFDDLPGLDDDASWSEATLENWQRMNANLTAVLVGGGVRVTSTPNKANKKA